MLLVVWRRGVGGEEVKPKPYQRRTRIFSGYTQMLIIIRPINFYTMYLPLLCLYDSVNQELGQVHRYPSFVMLMLPCQPVR